MFFNNLIIFLDEVMVCIVLFQACIAGGWVDNCFLRRVLKLESTSESSNGFVKMQVAGSYSNSCKFCVRWNPRTCDFYGFPGYVVVGPGSTLGKLLL